MPLTVFGLCSLLVAGAATIATRFDRPHVGIYFAIKGAAIVALSFYLSRIIEHSYWIWILLPVAIFAMGLFYLFLAYRIQFKDSGLGGAR
jgi:hypothetical protein